MEEVFESVINLLEEYSLKRTAKVLRKELRIVGEVTIGKDKEKQVLGALALT